MQMTLLPKQNTSMIKKSKKPEDKILKMRHYLKRLP